MPTPEQLAQLSAVPSWLQPRTENTPNTMFREVSIESKILAEVKALRDEVREMRGVGSSLLILPGSPLFVMPERMVSDETL